MKMFFPPTKASFFSQSLSSVTSCFVHNTQTEWKRFRLKLGKMDVQDLRPELSALQVYYRVRLRKRRCVQFRMFLCLWARLLFEMSARCSPWVCFYWNVCHLICIGSESEHLYITLTRQPGGKFLSVIVLSFQEHQAFESMSLHQLPNFFSALPSCCLVTQNAERGSGGGERELKKNTAVLFLLFLHSSRLVNYRRGKVKSTWKPLR